MDVNKVTLIGRLTDKPKERALQTGQKLARFSVATNYLWKDYKTKQKKEKVEFHNVTVWGKLAEIALTYLEKGSRIYLEGRLQYRKYEDKEQQQKFFTDIIADEIIMLGHGNKTEKSASAFAKEEPGEKELVVEEV
jgi:single-strand DNA-binding protein